MFFLFKDNIKLVEDRLSIYQNLIDIYFSAEHSKIKIEKKQYNFEIKDKYPDLYKKVYSSFINLCINNFTKFENYTHYDSLCAYVSNKNNYDSWVHNHGKVANELVAVYYFSVPKGNNGELVFYKDDGITEIIKYKPEEFDLLVFPSYLNHKPLPLDSNHFRISLNMTLKADYLV